MEKTESEEKNYISEQLNEQTRLQPWSREHSKNNYPENYLRMRGRGYIKLKLI